MCGRFYPDTTHADHANLIMRYLSIRWSDSETGNTIVTIRILRSFLWYAMNELMHTIHEQINACDARTKWCMRWKIFFFFWYMDGHSSQFSWLNYECKLECLHPCYLIVHFIPMQASLFMTKTNNQSQNYLINFNCLTN